MSPCKSDYQSDTETKTHIGHSAANEAAKGRSDRREHLTVHPVVSAWFATICRTVQLPDSLRDRP